MSEEEREAIREKNRIYQTQYRKAHPDKVAIWSARTWQRKAGYNETKPRAEWIKHDKGFFRLRVGMDYTPWFTYLLDPDTIIEICNLENAEVEWKADYECSMCGSRAWEEGTNYCPNCGAEMNA